MPYPTQSHRTVEWISAVLEKTVLPVAERNVSLSLLFEYAWHTNCGWNSN